MSARTSRVEPEIGAAKAAAAAAAAAAAVKSKGNSVDPPLLQRCFRTGCIQEKKAEATTSIYLISLLRVVSLLKAPQYTLVQEGGGEGGASDGGGESGGGVGEGGSAGGGWGGESAAARRIRCLAAAGWIIFFVIAAACQFFLFVLILETSTSHTCDVKAQTGCRSGEYCSVSIANGQCNDCSAILPKTTTCCPTMNTTCPNITDPDFIYMTNAVTAPKNDLCHDGCPHACLMYNHCVNQKASKEERPKRCDFLVNGRNGVKWSHILLLIFGAVLWTRNLVQILDETNLIAATLPKATGEARKTHNVIVPPLPLEPHTLAPTAPCAHARSVAEGARSPRVRWRAAGAAVQYHVHIENVGASAPKRRWCDRRHSHGQ